jgi:hypothetical protein
MNTKKKVKCTPKKVVMKGGKISNIVPQTPKAVQKEKEKVMADNMNTNINRIMRTNLEKNELDASYSPFVSRFLKSLIREQKGEEEIAPEDEIPAATTTDAKNPEDFTPEDNKQAFDQSLEADTDPTQFETDGIPPEVTSDTIGQIQEWSSKLDEFAGFLNDPQTESLHKILADGDRAGSLLRGVTRKASDSITRIAGEVEKLKEILNTYIITAPKKLRDTEQLKAGS